MTHLHERCHRTMIGIGCAYGGRTFEVQAGARLAPEARNPYFLPGMWKNVLHSELRTESRKTQLAEKQHIIKSNRASAFTAIGKNIPVRLSENGALKDGVLFFLRFWWKKGRNLKISGKFNHKILNFRKITNAGNRNRNPATKLIWNCARIYKSRKQDSKKTVVQEREKHYNTKQKETLLHQVR